jgi:hypothetical protein
LSDGEAAIAYDPDGCQVWIIDDGVEGYSTPRVDPKTGPAGLRWQKYPPGTVLMAIPMKPLMRLARTTCRSKRVVIVIGTFNKGSDWSGPFVVAAPR